MEAEDSLTARAAKAPEPPPEGATVALTCANGHVSVLRLALIVRRDDGWCGTCGADVRLGPAAGRAEPLIELV